MNGRHPLARADDNIIATLRARDGSPSGYTELQTGCRFVYATPQAQPALWEEYLAGAITSYGRYGVESVLEYDTIRDGATTTLFIVAQAPDGTVVGGMRAQGRYASPAQAHALVEWAGQPGEALLWGEIEERLSLGVVEMKSGWVDDHFPQRRPLTAALARVIPHVMGLLQARYALCTVAEHAAPCWETTGARPSSMIPAIPYPDERYRTVPMWWDLTTIRELSHPDQWTRLTEEGTALQASRAPVNQAEISECTAA